MTKCSTGWIHPKTFRPNHDEFIENFNVMSVKQLMSHYSVSRDTTTEKCIKFLEL